MPDEIFHLAVESIFRLMSKQVGMATVAYDFRSDEQKQKDEWMKSEAGEVK